MADEADMTINLNINNQPTLRMIPCISLPASDPAPATSVQQDQASFAPGSTQISVVPPTPVGLAPETSQYQNPVPAATATLIAVTTQVTTPTSSTSQQTRTGRTSPSPAPTESPAPRRLSLPTPSQTPQNVVAESNGLDQLKPASSRCKSALPPSFDRRWWEWWTGEAAWNWRHPCFRSEAAFPFQGLLPELL